MNVTYVLTTADSAGGTERTIISQANWMASHAKVSILSLYRTAPQPHFEIDQRVNVVYAHSAGFPDNRLRSRLVPTAWDDQFDAASDNDIADALRRVRTDILVTTTPAQAMLAARLVSQSTRIIHQEHRHSANRGVGIEPLRLVADRLDTIAVLTERNREWLSRNLHIDHSRTAVIPNGIDVASFAQSGLNQPLIMGIGRFSAAKQFDHLVKAFAIATQDHTEWRLRLYGDGPAKPYLRTIAHRYDVEMRLELPGAVEQIDTQLAKSSIFALSSRSEALPMVLLEAQAAGVPAVSYDTPTGPREILTETAGGIIVPLNSVHGLASGLQLLIENPELRNELGASGRRNSWKFDSDAVMPTWLRLFRRLSAGRKGTLPGDIAATLPDLATVSLATDALPAAATSARGAEFDAQLGDRMRAMITDSFEGAGIAYTSEATPQHVWKIIAAQESVPAFMGLVRCSNLPVQLSARRGRELLAQPWELHGDPPHTAIYGTEFTFHTEAGRRLGTVEFWRQEDGMRVRPGGGDGPDRVDPQTWAKWLAQGAATPSGSPYWSDHTFDIDVVYTWVNGSDPDWRARRAAHLSPQQRATPHSDAHREARYISRDELYYSIRTVRRHLPWVRNIFVVTDRQVPERVASEFPDVQIIDHRQIFPDLAVLPTFNSHAIEASIHRIRGLSEHFLYFNDDLLIARSLNPGHFFTANGLPKFFPHGIPLQYGALDELPHLQAATNNRALILREFGIEITRNMLHTPHPHRVSTLAALEERFPDVFRVTRSSRFRSKDDYAILSSLGQYYGFATERYVPADIGYRYISLRADGLRRRLRTVLEDDRVDTVALGEPTAEDHHHPDEAELVADFLESFTNR